MARLLNENCGLGRALRHFFKLFAYRTIAIFKNACIMTSMDEITIFKALANPARRNVLAWLKAPEKHFKGWSPEDREKGGVCCGLIQKKMGLSQSTVSNYLALLERSGLLIATRHKQWTYYQRDERFIRELTVFLSKEL